MTPGTRKKPNSSAWERRKNGSRPGVDNYHSFFILNRDDDPVLHVSSVLIQIWFHLSRLGNSAASSPSRQRGNYTGGGHAEHGYGETSGMLRYSSHGPHGRRPDE